MRIFLAGATGAVGNVLVPLLVSAGHEVLGTSRSAGGVDRLEAAGASGVRLNVFDRTAVRSEIAAFAPDAVIHQLTALSGFSLSDNAQVRIEGTRNLVDACLDADVPRIVAQSISWAYEPGDTPADEQVPLDSTTDEPRATTIAGIRYLEQTVAELPEHVVLRYGLLYGPGTWYAPGSRVAEALRAGNILPTDGVSSFVHIADAASAAVQALSWPSGVVNIVDDDPAPAREWVPTLAAALGAPVPPPASGRASWERGADNTLARKLGLQLRFPTWREGFSAQAA